MSRWGLPLITNFFLSDAAMKERFSRATPANDQTPFVEQVGRVAETLATLAGSAANPRECASQVTARLFPTMLPYLLGTQAAFEFAGFNGRALTDDVMDVILTLASNTALGDGVAPDQRRTRPEFPYFGAPYTLREQAGVVPAGAGALKKW